MTYKESVHVGTLLTRKGGIGKCGLLKLSFREEEEPLAVYIQRAVGGKLRKVVTRPRSRRSGKTYEYTYWHVYLDGKGSTQKVLQEVWFFIGFSKRLQMLQDGIVHRRSVHPSCEALKAFDDEEVQERRKIERQVDKAQRAVMKSHYSVVIENLEQAVGNAPAPPELIEARAELTRLELEGCKPVSYDEEAARYDAMMKERHGPKGEGEANVAKDG